LQVPGQEAQPLAGLHRRTGQDDAVHLLVPKRLHGGGHGQIRLAGARRAHADGDGVLQDGLDILLLTDGLGLDGPALGADAQYVAGELGDLGLLAAAHQADDVADVLLPDGLPPRREGQQGLDGLAGQHGVLRLALHPELPVPVHHRDGELLLQQADVLVKGAKNIHGLLQPLNADSLFQGITPVSPGHQPPDSSVGSV
jgi:hypothetical protein